MGDRRLPERREPWRAHHSRLASPMRSPNNAHDLRLSPHIHDDDEDRRHDVLGDSGPYERYPEHWKHPRAASEHFAEYVSEDRSSYTLWDTANYSRRQIAKWRAVPDAYPPPPKYSPPGSRVQRLSIIALVGALIGGAPGIALGLCGIVVACIRLSSFGARQRAWRRRSESEDAPRRLPSAATSERLRLLTGLGQSLIAMLVGSAILLLLMAH